MDTLIDCPFKAPILIQQNNNHRLLKTSQNLNKESNQHKLAAEDPFFRKDSQISMTLIE